MQKSKKNKILVTGGAGFIGSVLVRSLLEEGHRVCVLDNLMYGEQSLLGVRSHPGFSLIRGDIRDTKIIRNALMDVFAVVHLAAIVGDPACSRDTKLARQVNLDASLALLNECKDRDVSRFVFASTCSNYGKMEDENEFVDELTELKPVSLYAETKVAVEKAVLDPTMMKNICTTSLRFATVYGVSPRMRFDLTVNEFTMEMLTKKHLVVYGGQFWRPYAHVKDIARAIKTVLALPEEKVNNQVYNVGSTDQNYQKQQLVQLIKQSCAPDATIENIHKEEDPRNYRVDFTKIKDQLGFEISRSVQDGIAEVAEFVNSHADLEPSSCSNCNAVTL